MWQSLKLMWVAQQSCARLVPDSCKVRGQCENTGPGFAQLDSPLVHTPVPKGLFVSLAAPQKLLTEGFSSATRGSQ